MCFAQLLSDNGHKKGDALLLVSQKQEVRDDRIEVQMILGQQRAHTRDDLSSATGSSLPGEVFSKSKAGAGDAYAAQAQPTGRPRSDVLAESEYHFPSEPMLGRRTVSMHTSSLSGKSMSCCYVCCRYA